MNDSLYRIACTLAIINVLLCEGILGELWTKTTSKYIELNIQISNKKYMFINQKITSEYFLSLVILKLIKIYY